LRKNTLTGIACQDHSIDMVMVYISHVEPSGQYGDAGIRSVSEIIDFRTILARCRLMRGDTLVQTKQFLASSMHDDWRERPVHCGPCPQSWRDAGYEQRARVRTGSQIEHRKLDTQPLSLSGELVPDCASRKSGKIRAGTNYPVLRILLRCPLPCSHFSSEARNQHLVSTL
jgi:hypothetical protein